MSKTKPVTNVVFLAQHLTQHPGSTAMEARKALAAFKGIPFRHGLYHWYFAVRNNIQIKYGQAKQGAEYGYWRMVEEGNHKAGWVITELGGGQGGVGCRAKERLGFRVGTPAS